MLSLGVRNGPAFGAFSVSDSKKDPKIPPPDDFSKTTPNVSFEEEDDSGWDDVGADVPKETPADDWGKTVINYNVSEEHHEEESFGEQQHPSPESPAQPDWGMTQANVGIDEEFSEPEEKADQDYGVTTPYFRLPELERKKYQNIPPTPTEQAAEEEKKSKGGIPLWFWVGSAILIMLAFSFVIFLGIWFFLLGDRGFDVVIIGAKPGSRFKVNGSEWGIATEGGRYRLSGLQAGTKTIEIINPNATCSPNPFPIQGEDGKTYEKLVSCTAKEVANTNCAKTTDVAERAKCAEDALDALGNPPDLDKLIDALNLLIINFASNKSDIPDDKKAILRKASTKINQLPSTVVIEVGGHTDNVGSDSYNQGLSEDRANAVRDALIGFGVRDSALTARGYGEKQPIATNNTETGRLKNRRIQYSAVKR